MLKPNAQMGEKAKQTLKWHPPHAVSSTIFQMELKRTRQKWKFYFPLANRRTTTSRTKQKRFEIDSKRPLPMLYCCNDFWSNSNIAGHHVPRVRQLGSQGDWVRPFDLVELNRDYLLCEGPCISGPVKCAIGLWDKQTKQTPNEMIKKLN